MSESSADKSNIITQPSSPASPNDIVFHNVDNNNNNNGIGDNPTTSNPAPNNNSSSINNPPSPHVSYILLSEFDILKGSQLRYQYPDPIKGLKDSMLAEVM